MNINYELYKIFYTVAKNKNITSASKELLISQPAISKSIKHLEESLGGQLFTRTKRGVILTSEGEEFYNYIKNAIEYINNAENKFSDLINLETGTVKIGVSTNLTKEYLMPYLKKFHEKYPKITVEIITDKSDNLYIKLRNGLIDFIVLNLPNKDVNDIEFIKCKQVRDIFITSDISMSGKKYSINDLIKYPLILQAYGSNTRKFVDNYFNINNTKVKPIIDATSYTLVIEFVKAGFGIGTGTKEFLMNDLNKTIYEIDIYPPMPPRYVGVALSKNNVLNFSSKKLIQIIKGEL